MLEAFARELSEIPEIRDGEAGNYQTLTPEKILKNFKQQFALQQELVINHDFSKLLPEFRDLSEYEIALVQKQMSSQYFVTLEFAKKLAAGEIEVSVSKNIKNDKAVFSEIYEKIRNQGAEGLRIGIISALDENAKKALLREPSLTKQLSELSGLEIDEKVFSENFEFERHELEEDKKNYAGLIEELKKRSEETQKLFNLFIGLLAKKKQSEDFQSLIVEVLNMNAAELNKVATDLGLKIDKKHFFTLLKWYRGLNGEKSTKASQKMANSFHLVETPPYIGILRGCFGGDCSTSLSWAYPNSPVEKDFFVVNKDRVAGYISTTIVEMEGKRVLLLKDLQGPRISEDMAKQILVFLHTHYSKKVDAVGLAITNRNFVRSNNNYNVLKELLFEEIDGVQKTYKVNFLDEELRKLFAKHVGSSSYDSPTRHPEATFYNLNRVKRPEISFNEKKSRYDFFNLSKEELYKRYHKFDKKFVLNIIYNDLDLSEYEMSSKEINFINQVITGFESMSGNLTVLTFREKIEEFLKEYLTQSEMEQLEKSRPEIFIRARLKLPDALTTTHIEEFTRTHNQLAWIFENGDVSDFHELFKQKLKTEPDKVFIDQLVKIYEKGGEASYNNVMTLYGQGFSFLEGEADEKARKVIITDFIQGFEKENFRYVGQQFVDKFKNYLDFRSGRALIENLEKALQMIGVEGDDLSSIPPALHYSFAKYILTKQDFHLVEKAVALLEGFSFEAKSKILEEEFDYILGSDVSRLTLNNITNLHVLDNFTRIQKFVEIMGKDVEKTKVFSFLTDKADTLGLSPEYFLILSEFMKMGLFKVSEKTAQTLFDKLWANMNRGGYFFRRIKHVFKEIKTLFPKMKMDPKTVEKAMGFTKDIPDDEKLIAFSLFTDSIQPGEYEDKLSRNFKRLLNKVLQGAELQNISEYDKLMGIKAWLLLKGPYIHPNSKKTAQKDLSLINKEALDKESLKVWTEIEQLLVDEKKILMCGSML